MKPIKIYLVDEVDYDYCHTHGAYEDKAEAEKHKEYLVEKNVWGAVEVTEIEMFDTFNEFKEYGTD